MSKKPSTRKTPSSSGKTKPGRKAKASASGEDKATKSPASAKEPRGEKPAAVPAVANHAAICDEADQAVMQAAEQVFDHLQTRVKHFQDTLPENYELGIQLANFGGSRAVHVRGMGFRNPNIIEFYGLLDGKTQVAVVQHVSQLNFMLVAVPPAAEKEPYRIGFGADLTD